MSSSDERRDPERVEAAHSLGFDEFGIMRDEPSSNSLDEPHLNDGGIGANISSSLLNEFAADTTGASEDLTQHSDPSQLHSAHDETESLTEFEEIERLIKAHTIQESDEDLPELPIDLEERILSGRVSRASDPREGVNSSSSSSPSPEDYEERTKTRSGPHQDTGYASEGHGSAAVLDSSDGDHSMDRHERGDDAIARYLPIPTDRQAVGDTQQPDSLVATFGTTEDFEELLKQQLDETSAEEVELGDEGATGDASLAFTTATATGELERTRATPHAAPRNAGKSTKLRLSADGSRSASRLPQKQSSGEKDRRPLETKSRVRKSARSGTGRSPAAGRVKRATSGARLSYHNSSDDLSIRSDVSRTELRSKLKEEARSRKLDEEFMTELKSDYDALLMKYAEAENTIDHLRLGAKINLYASIPRPHSESQPQLEPMHEDMPDTPQVAPPSYEHVRLPSGDSGAPAESSLLRSSGSDPLVESSLQLPAAATKEFLKIALQLQAKDLKDKMDSFAALLRETELSAEEEEQVMRGIEEALQRLEAEYLEAIDQHAVEQRRASIATGGAINASQEFDPDRSMEEEIMTLGQIVKNLRQQMNSVLFGDGSPPVTPPDVESRFNELVHQYQTPLQRPGFLQQMEPPSTVWSQSGPRDHLRRERPDVEESHGTGHGTPYSTERSFPSESDTSCSSESEHEDQGNPPRLIPNRYLEPSPHSDDVIKPGSNGATTTPKTRLEGSPANLRAANKPRSSSKLPRPVARSSRGDGDPGARPGDGSPGARPVRGDGDPGARPVRGDGSRAEKKMPVNTGTDSGFVGSESSRQSAAARLQPAKIKLVSVPPSASVEVRKVPEHRSDRRAPPRSSVSTSTQSGPSYRQPTSFAGLEGFGAFRPPHAYSVDDETTDDVSTTSTVREMLRPRSVTSSTVPAKHSARRSASVKSTGSTARSMASTTRDSALNLIRGEISKLREEMEEARLRETPRSRETPRTSTPRRRPMPSMDSTNGESLQKIRDDIKALKDELQKDKRKKRTSESGSAISAAPSTQRRSRSESRGRDRSTRSRSRDGSTERGRRRTRSHERHWEKGYWAYVPAANQPVYGQSPVPVIASTPRAVPAVIRPPVPTFVHAPVIYPPVSYVAPQSPSRPGRVYLKEGFSTPSKPKASTFTSKPRLRKANIYVVTSDDDDVTLHRSHSLPRKSVFLATSGSDLDESLKRAERSSNALRCHSRAIYRSTRDSFYGARLLADTL